MDLSLLNKPHFYFLCTNYGRNKDGIGHYTSKIVNELKKNSALQVTVCAQDTHHLSKLNLFLSTRMLNEVYKLNKKLNNSSQQGYIVIEYPFVEYNPLFLVLLYFFKIRSKGKFKLVVSLHEYSRTKPLRKLFIRGLIPLSDIVLFTKEEDIEPFQSNKILFRKRTIPANIEPTSSRSIEPFHTIHICYFGIINLKTKAIENMLKGWELFCAKTLDNRINFHFITSAWKEGLEQNTNIKYHLGLDDHKVSVLLQQMHYMVLPLQPKVSINNGSLAVGCVHKCVPVGLFDVQFFKENFGVGMEAYSTDDFVEVYERINAMDYKDYEKKAIMAYHYGQTRLPSHTAKTYSDLVVT